MKRPEPKMPRGRQIRMVAVAFTFEVLQTICSLVVVFAPLLICYFAKFWVQDWTSSETAGDLACWAAGLGLAASYIVGVGVAIAMFGWAMGAAVSTLALLVFTFWFMYARITFFDRLGTRLMLMTVGPLIEFIPFINVLPWWTATIWLITQDVRKEDREARKKYDEWVTAKKASIEKQLAEEAAEERILAPEDTVS